MIESNGIKIHIKDGKSESKHGKQDASNPEVETEGNEEAAPRKEAQSAPEPEDTEIVADTDESGSDSPDGDEDSEPEVEDAPDYRDLYLRARAELDNVQKTVPKRIREGVERFKRDHFLQLLELADGFDRAAVHIENMDMVSDQWKEGMESLRRITTEILGKAGVKRMETANATFDPNRHEVISALPAPGRKDGEILEELRSGWTLDGRLLRAALVVVARNEE